MNKKAIIALMVSVGGLLSHPEVLGILNEEWSTVLSAVGILLQALTKAINERS